MDNTIDIKKLLEQSSDDAETTIKEGAARTVELGDLIAAIGCAIEAYVKTIRAVESRLPDLGRKHDITLVTAGILMATGAPEAFSVDKADMYQFADIIYNTALFECGFGAGGPGEGAI